MDGEMVAMWRTANGLVGVPGQMSHPASDATWNPSDARARESSRPISTWRRWVPSLERTPPLLQFIVRVMQWVNVKCHPTATPAPQLRLVGQLALGAKRHLSLVEVGGAQFLVGGGVDHVTVIVPIPTADPLPTEKPHNTGRPHSL